MVRNTKQHEPKTQKLVLDVSPKFIYLKRIENASSFVYKKKHSLMYSL